METRAHHVVVGAFVLGVVGLIFVAVIWLARFQFNREFAHYDIYFTGSVTGLTKGATVTYSGVHIGRVAEIELDPKNVEQVRVTIQVDSDIPIMQDAITTLEPQGITGYAFVQITGGTQNSPDVTRKDDERYPVIMSRPSTLETLFNTAPEILNKTKMIADQLSDVLNDNNRAAISETLANVRNATASLGGSGAEIHNLLGDADGMVKELRAAILTANHTLDSVDRTLTGKDGTADKLNLAMNELSGAAKRFGDVAQRLDALVQENRAPIREFSQRSLPEVNQLIVEARALIQGLTRVAAEIERDPPRFFFGDRREGYRPR